MCSQSCDRELWEERNSCECSSVRAFLALASRADSKQDSGLGGVGCNKTAIPVSSGLWLTSIYIVLQHRCCLNLLFELLTYLTLDSCEASHLHIIFLSASLCRRQFAFLLSRQRATCMQTPHSAIHFSWWVFFVGFLLLEDKLMVVLKFGWQKEENYYWSTEMTLTIFTIIC